MRFLIFGLLTAFFAPTMLSAQTQDTILPSISYNQPKEFEIGGVRVVGTQYADANTLIAISGLRVGDKIRIPGSAFPKAIQALWALHLFTDVQINRERTVGEKVFIEIAVKELPRYTRHTFTGVKKSKHDDLNGIITKYLQKGAILTENIKATLINSIENYFVEKGFLNAKVKILSFKDERSTNGNRLEFVIDQGKRVKIRDIRFYGNEHIKAKVLRKKMKNTARISRIFKKSKLVKKEYEEDKLKIEAYYNTLGFRDARIVKDSITRNSKGQ
ncbi:MAG: outer membrane protein assembly factor BamA, partial [Bacteroidetes bacterium]|nr:outer membrane protein assembly factor BamA [Bacteroidota bacterium]